MNYCGEGVRSTHQWIHEVVRYRIPVHAILSLFHIYFFQASPLSQLEGSSVEWCVVIQLGAW